MSSSKIIFISYSHDSAEHRERVLGLSERLRADGFDVRLDQYVNGTPEEGWPRWMLNQLDHAEFILVVCTKTYYKRFRGHEEPDRGFGVDWKGSLITTKIYNARSRTIKFVPVLFDPAAAEFIPEALPAGTRYTLNSEENYQSLLDFLRGVAGVEPGPIGPPDVRERRRGTPSTFEGAANSETATAAPKIFHLPQPKNPQFVGREDLLKQLRGLLQTNRTAAVVQVVAGIGGVGKTQLVVEYAYRHQSEYDVVWSVRCEQPSTLASDYAALAERLGLAENDAADQNIVVQAVRRWFESNDRWLLVMDNVVNPADVDAYRPENPRGNILITSQNQQWKGWAQKLPVETFQREESLDLLLGKGQRPAAALASADALASELGDLPLALAQAAAYIEATGTTIEGYLLLFRQRRVDLWKQEEPPAGYQKTVAETFSLATDRLRDEAEPALRLLNLCALLAPEDIPRSLLNTAAGDELALNTQLAALRRYSLVDVAADAVAVHRLVQTICRDRWSDTERAELQDSDVALVDSAWPPGDFHDDPATWPTCERLMPHARAVLSQGADSATTSHLWNRLGMYCRIRADFESARVAYESSVRVAESVFGPDSPELATSLNDLAQLLLDMDRLAEAEPMMRRTLAIDEQSYVAEHPMISRDLNNLAALLFEMNRLAEAEPLFRRTLAIAEQSYGAEHPAVATRLNNLAQLLQATNRLAEAEPMMRRAMAILEQSYGAEHPKVAISLNVLSHLLQATNQFAEAEPLLRRALAIDEKTFGVDHPTVALRLGNLAMLLKRTNRLAQAEPMMRRALAIDKQSYGAEHPNVAMRLHNLAQLLKATNRLAESEPTMRRALAIAEQSYGAEHPLVVIRVNKLAQMLQATNRLAEAESLIRRALVNAEQCYGPGHPDVALKIYNLATLLLDMNRLTEAEPLMRRHLEIFVAFQRSTGHEHPHFQAAVGNYRYLLTRMGRSEADIDATLRAIVEG